MDCDMVDDERPSMYRWIDIHNTHCKHKDMGISRFRFSSVECPSNGVCIVTIQCKCGEVKNVTVYDRTR